MTVYYNEIDPYAAQWLRNLIAAGHIATGDVDERSILDVSPDDLQGYTQCHFFAGIGVWSHALRRAGWDDDRPIWTGSCPCQPFSQAGKSEGFLDDRHLWPYFYRLIKECGPSVVAGEQVASKDVDPWIDLVQTDLEALDYAFGCVALPAAGVGAPTIRDRTFWMAHTDYAGLERQRLEHQLPRSTEDQSVTRSSLVSEDRTKSSPTNGFWSNIDWVYCKFNRWRPIEPSLSPMATRSPDFVGRVRAYGNSLNAEVARIFVECAMECLP